MPGAAPSWALRRAPGPAASPDSPYPSSSARHRVALPGFASLPPPLLVQGREEEAEGEGEAQQVRPDSAPRWRTATDPVSPDAPTTPAPSSCTPDPPDPRRPREHGQFLLLPHCPVQPVSTVPRLLHWSCKQILAKTAKLGLELSAPRKRFATVQENTQRASAKYWYLGGGFTFKETNAREALWRMTEIISLTPAFSWILLNTAESVQLLEQGRGWEVQT